MLVLSAVAMLGVACDRTEKVGETSTTSASPSVPAEANPAPPAPIAPLDPSVPPGAAQPTGAEKTAPRPAGQMAPTGMSARPEMKDAGASVHMNAPTPLPRTQPKSYDGNVGPGHIITPVLPGEPRATGAPNNDGSHNIGSTH